MPFLPARRTFFPRFYLLHVNVRALWPVIQSLSCAAHPECSQQTPLGSGCRVDVQPCCYFCYFQPLAQLSEWIVEMQSSGDTNTEHLLPHQPDEQLDAKGASLCCHGLCAAFLKEQRRRKQQDSCSGAGFCCA